MCARIGCSRDFKAAAIIRASRNRRPTERSARLTDTFETRFISERLRKNDTLAARRKRHRLRTAQLQVGNPCDLPAPLASNKTAFVDFRLVKYVTKIGVFLLISLLGGAPVFACVLPGANTTAEEAAC